MINTYYKSQKELVSQMILLIDGYWKREISENELTKILCLLVERNKDIMYKNGELASIVKQRLGKKRIRLLNCILSEKEVDIDEKK